MVKIDGFAPPYGDCEHLRVPFETVGETQNPIQGAVDIYRGFSLTVQCYGEIFANSSRYKQLGNIGVQLGRKFADDVAFALGALERSEIYTVFALASLWTLARYLLVNCIFRPGAIWAGVQDKNVEKLCESAWKAFAYFIMWALAFDVVFFRGYDFFANPIQMFSDWTPEKPPTDLSLSYAIECSFYLHCVYATIFMDAWRKDSVVMLIHHFVSNSLIVFSYTIKCLKIGVLIFCLNDIGDVLLEGGKVALYLRHRKTAFSRFFSTISDITAGLFAATWFSNRLWFHITKVWRSGALGLWVSHPVLPVPFHIFLNVFLGALYLFYLYWSWFLIIFVIRVIFGKGGSADDPREDETATSDGNKDRKKKA